MEIISNVNNLPCGSWQGNVVTIGVFDGVHAGHQDVIRRCAGIKRSTGSGKSILLTFDRHPLSVTNPDRAPRLLTTLEEKISLLGYHDIDCIVIERFTAEMSGMDYGTFIAERLVKRLGMIHLVVGYDFHLGRGREGSQLRLVGEGRRSGFDVTIVPPVVLYGRVVSSTKIRRAILERKLDEAERFLTRPFFFDAEVIRGEGIGRGLGFPTANVEVPGGDKLIPPDGVYAVRVTMGGDTHGGMMNIGSAPTVHGGGARRIEIHVFGFDGDLYGERLRIFTVGFIRNEKKFDDPDRLQTQLVLDRNTALRILEKKD